MYRRGPLIFVSPNPHFLPPLPGVRPVHVLLLSPPYIECTCGSWLGGPGSSDAEFGFIFSAREQLSSLNLHYITFELWIKF